MKEPHAAVLVMDQMTIIILFILVQPYDTSEGLEAIAYKVVHKQMYCIRSMVQRVRHSNDISEVQILLMRSLVILASRRP